MIPGEGYVIFCEDIRREQNGRHSIVGVFDNDIVFREPFPNTMPKLGVLSTVFLDIDNLPSELTIVFNASWSADSIVEVDIQLDEDPPEEIKAAIDNYKANYPRDELSLFEGTPRPYSFVAVIPLFDVPEEGMLRVICRIGERETILGRKCLRTSAVDSEELSS